jgi:anti-anti-sigma regulatory factor
MRMPVPATTGIHIAQDPMPSALTTLVYLGGSIDAGCEAVLRNTFDPTGGEGLHVVVDMTNVGSINVGGLFALHSVAIDIRTLHGGCFILQNVNDSIRWLFEILPLNLPIEEGKSPGASSTDEEEKGHADFLRVTSIEGLQAGLSRLDSWCATASGRHR